MAQFGAHERSQTFPSSNHLGSQALGRIPSNQSYIDLGSSSIYSINTYILPEPISYTHRLRTRSSPAAAVTSLELSFPLSSTSYEAGNKGPLGPFSAEKRSHTSCTSRKSVSRENPDTFDSFDPNQHPFLNHDYQHSALTEHYHIPYRGGCISPPVISSVSLDLYLRDSHPAQEPLTLADISRIPTPNTSDSYLELSTSTHIGFNDSQPLCQHISNTIPQTPIRSVRSSARIDSITRDLQALETPRSPGKPKSPESQIRLGRNGVLLTPGDRDGVMGLGIVYPLPPKPTPVGAKRRVLSYHSVRDEYISPHQPDTPIKKLVKPGEHQWRARHRTISTGDVLPLPTNRTYGRTYRRRLGKYPFNHVFARLLFFSLVGFLLAAIFGVGSDPATHTPGVHWGTDDMWIAGDEGQVFGIYGPSKPAFAISSIRSYDDYDLVSTQKLGPIKHRKANNGYSEGTQAGRQRHRRKGWFMKMRGT